ncbi:hypothetical protein STEG23_005470, partial [Scotinomys teguina]
MFLVSVSLCVHVSQQLWRSEGTFQKSVLFFLVGLTLNSGADSLVFLGEGRYSSLSPVSVMSAVGSTDALYMNEGIPLN